MAPRLRTLVPTLGVLGLISTACSTGTDLPVNAAGSGGGSAAIANPTAVVTLKYVSFEPARVTIHVGQTVEWKWDDAPLVHNVVFRTFSSSIKTTGTYFHTFDTAGTFNYTCTVHANMN